MNIGDALQKSYEDLLPLSRHWQRELKKHGETAGFLIDNLKNLKGKRILDIGCGLGIFIHALSLLGAEAEGVDKHILNEWGLAGITEAWQKNNIKVTVGDFFEASLGENIFDAVIAENIFEHLRYNQKEFLEKIYKLLAPGGILILSTPNLASALKRARLLLGRSPYWDLKDFFLNKIPYGHIREFTSEELKWMAEACNFTDVRAETRNINFKTAWLKNPKKYPALLSWLASGACPSLRDTIFLIAQKP